MFGMTSSELLRKMEESERILLDAVTLDEFEAVHGEDSFCRLTKAQLISGQSGRLYARRTALDEGPLRHG